MTSDTLEFDSGVSLFVHGEVDRNFVGVFLNFHSWDPFSRGTFLVERTFLE